MGRYSFKLLQKEYNLLPQGLNLLPEALNLLLEELISMLAPKKSGAQVGYWGGLDVNRGGFAVKNGQNDCNIWAH